jgi:hypothetical protein
MLIFVLEITVVFNNLCIGDTSKYSESEHTTQHVFYPVLLLLVIINQSSNDRPKSRIVFVTVNKSLNLVNVAQTKSDKIGLVRNSNRKW